MNESYTKFKMTDGNSIEYGFGWRIKEDGESKIVSHSRDLSGFRTFIERDLNNKLSFFYLTNYGNSIPIGEINEGLRNIINKKPYSLPIIID